MAGKPVCHNGHDTEPAAQDQPGAWVRAYGRLPLPADLNWLWTIGAILCAILALMLLSGLTLTLAYTPDAGLAFGSVEGIERRMPAGWLLRAMHMTGASFFMLALYIHLLRGLYYRSYQPPRRAVWLSGCGLLVMVMVTAFAGYVLPWGQMSYWGADVAGKAVGALPLVGGWLEGVFLGGDAPGTPTLHRMFALHFGLAFLIVAMVAGHIAHVHARGSSSPSARPVEVTGALPFHPYFTVRDMLAIVLVAITFVGVLCFWPELIAEPANYRPANPLHTPADIEPEWYFLPFYGMMQAVPFKLGGLLLSGGAVAVLFAVPWLDRRAGAACGAPALVRVFAVAVLICSAVAAACAGLHHMQGYWLLVARLGMVGYYAYFLAYLPLSGRLQRGGAA
ncbi:cytochrome b [Acetobacter lambici]|uniref:Cytochrome b n=1 Tax=Acetobacter lambici TaxID=1332824 RepID=A0ABT1EWP7_9PROT|nr:cytochrome b [Acetobacter lambici]MCP1243143.1 cytochrome b N-terminal domain-containing protein [Acetobacter lambici]MCP1257375.1 cytochrome b N-terminal domain-containing protein [Acetobacter lambici]NHO55862.1 cytochrome b [Acetobacter lambici]